MLLVGAGDRDGGSLRTQRARDRQSDSTRPAGDERDFSGK